jgi:hypothetical protein
MIDLNKAKLIGISILSGFLFGVLLFPTKPKTEIKEVIKTVQVDSSQNNKHTIIKKKKNKDGSEETTIEIIDKNKKQSINQQEYSKQATVNHAGIGIGLYAITDFKLKQPDYGILIEVPVISKLSVIASGDTAKRFSLGLKLEF